MRGPRAGSGPALAAALCLRCAAAGAAEPTATLTAPRLRGAECDADQGGDAGSTVDPALVWMGTIMIIAASFLSCFAVNLQKWGINHNDARAATERRPLYREWRWVLGMIAMVAASLMDLAALPFVPLSRVAALGCSTIVANIIITPLFLRERLTKHDVVGCLVCLAGTVLATVFGAKTESSTTTECLIGYFLRDTFIVYGTTMLVFLISLRYLCEGYQRKRQQALEQDVCRRFECVWVWTNLDYVRDRTGADHLLFPFLTCLGPQFYPACHATLGGLCGANSIMFAKTVLKCFVNLLKGTELLASAVYLTVFLLPFGLCLYMQVGYLNKALSSYCDALFVLPVYQACWIVGGIACGMLLYQEYRQLSVLDTAFFSAGVATSLGGLVVLSFREVRGYVPGRSSTRGSLGLSPTTGPASGGTAGVAKLSIGGMISLTGAPPVPLEPLTPADFCWDLSASFLGGGGIGRGGNFLVTRQPSFDPAASQRSAGGGPRPVSTASSRVSARPRSASPGVAEQSGADVRRGDYATAKGQGASPGRDNVVVPLMVSPGEVRALETCGAWSPPESGVQALAESQGGAGGVASRPGSAPWPPHTGAGSPADLSPATGSS